MTRFLCSAALAVLVAGPAIAESKYVKLVHVETGKVLGVEDDSGESGARAVLAKDEEKNEARQWKLEKDGSEYKIVNRKTGKVLDVFEASTDEGAQIIQWDDKPEGFDNQRWSWTGEESAKERRLKGKQSGHMLDVGDGDKIVQKKEDEKAKSQLWKVVEVKE